MPVETRSETALPSVAAADQLWKELHCRLRGFIRARISDPEAADDLAQEVVLRLHRSLDGLRAEDRLDAFAYRVARNAIIDHYRARTSARETPEAPDELVARVDADGDDAEEPDGRARQELARCLAPLIRQLPEPYREALTLTDLGKLSQVEAAEVVGLSVPGTKARVQRARAQVHELLTAAAKWPSTAAGRSATCSAQGPVPARLSSSRGPRGRRTWGRATVRRSVAAVSRRRARGPGE